ncbi:hypothetical protein ACJX0J_023968, partial [Zea mays]
MIVASLTFGKRNNWSYLHKKMFRVGDLDNDFIVVGRLKDEVIEILRAHDSNCYYLLRDDTLFSKQILNSMLINSIQNHGFMVASEILTFHSLQSLQPSVIRV